jgi:hypothetical protein
MALLSSICVGNPLGRVLQSPLAVAVTLSVLQAGRIPWYIFAQLLFLVVALGALP